MAVGDISKGLRDRVRERVGKRSLQGLLDATIYAFLNRAQMDLAARLADGAMPEVSKQATGNMTGSTLPLPSDFWRDRLLQIGTPPVAAHRWNVTELDALANNSLYLPSATNPFYYVWQQGGAVKILVDLGAPTSTAAYALHYQIQPPDLSDAADPLFGLGLHDLLVDYAVARVRQGLRQYEQAERELRRYYVRVAVINSRFAPGSLYEGAPGDA